MAHTSPGHSHKSSTIVPNGGTTGDDGQLSAPLGQLLDERKAASLHRGKVRPAAFHVDDAHAIQHRALDFRSIVHGT